MSDENNRSTKVVLGLIVGGVMGAAALYSLNAARSRKTPVVQKIGKTISEIGEMIEHCDGRSGYSLAERALKSLPAGKDLFDTALDWVSTGMHLWKKIKH